jgi:hypothetical protein
MRSWVLFYQIWFSIYTMFGWVTMSDKAFEEWNDCTGYFTKGTSYYYEMQSIIEDIKKASRKQAVDEVIQILEKPKTWLIASQDDILLYQKDVIDEIRKRFEVKDE